jgi:hypothetical protein
VHVETEKQLLLDHQRAKDAAQAAAGPLQPDQGAGPSSGIVEPSIEALSSRPGTPAAASLHGEEGAGVGAVVGDERAVDETAGSSLSDTISGRHAAVL